MFEFIATLINSFLNTIGVGITNDMNYKNARMNEQWQQQENERAFQRDLQMWNLQNNYNSPLNQRKRIEEAGGNAMLAFGNGVQISSGNASNAPKLAPAKAIPTNLAPYNQMGLNASSVLNDVKQTMMLKGDLKLQETNIMNMEEELRHKKLINDVLEGSKDYDIDMKREQLRQLMNQNDLFDETKDTVIDQMKSTLNLTQKQIDNYTELIEKIKNENDLLEADKNAKKILTSDEYVIWQNIIMPIFDRVLSVFGEVRNWRSSFNNLIDK